eukprot:1883591-Prorocentrum_lima.AAC.1
MLPSTVWPQCTIHASQTHFSDNALHTSSRTLKECGVGAKGLCGCKGWQEGWLKGKQVPLLESLQPPSSKRAEKEPEKQAVRRGEDGINNIFKGAKHTMHVACW